MGRFAVLLDWSGSLDLRAALSRVRDSLTQGGSLETGFEIVRPPFAALILSHRDSPPFVEERGALAFEGGFGPPLDGVHTRLDRLRALLERPEACGADPPPQGAAGRRCLLRWSAKENELLLASEPDGLSPAFVYSGPTLTVLASEPKAVWALGGPTLTLDPGTIADFCSLGQPMGDRTLFREVRSVAPGTVQGFGVEGVRRTEYFKPRFSVARTADGEALAESAVQALLGALAPHREVGPVTVALSGGMDSRFGLAGARRTWPRLEADTFGPEGCWDVSLAREVARRAGVPHRCHPPSERFLEEWGAFAVWRTDGLLSCLNAQGMDAMVAAGRRSRFVLNGMAGDVLMGSFLRPGDLLGRGDPQRATREIVRRRRFHDRSLAEMLKPGVLAGVGEPPERALLGVMSRYEDERLGNTLLGYWLRHHCARFAAMGLALEAPFVEYLTPLADVLFVQAVSELPLELRFMGRTYRRALRKLEPDLLAVPWERFGLAPRWPWPALALGKAALKWGLRRRPGAAGGHGLAPGSSGMAWARGLLLDPRTLADGYFLPGYLVDVVERHERGESDRAKELGIALTLELWRRIFVERSLHPAPPAAAGPG